MKIKNKLKKYRMLAGYKQDDSAKFLNISIRQYQNLESQIPKSVIQFYKLAKLYGTTIDALLEQDDEKEPPKLPSESSSRK